MYKMGRLLPKRQIHILNAALIIFSLALILLLLLDYAGRRGRYSGWSKFSPCSRSCGGGMTLRKRSCINVIYSTGKADCSDLGASYETRICNQIPCPVNGGFENWSAYTQCSKSCGGGTRMRKRNCIEPAPMWGGADCRKIGKYKETSPCNEHKCPVDGGYSSWSSWSECSLSCGGGQQRRNRYCTNPVPLYGGKGCATLGNAEETKLCNTIECAIDGGYGEWEKWGLCDVSCGDGKQHRIRQCNNPVPSNGGKNCDDLGKNREVQHCLKPACQVNGTLSEWSLWSMCSKTCDGGQRSRKRTCNNTVILGNGKTCKEQGLGPMYETAICNTMECQRPK